MLRTCFLFLLALGLGGGTLRAGCIKGDCRNGYGTFVYPGGAKYVGEFREGKAHGKGILYFANGNKYIGYWAENHRHGSGRFLFAEGHEYIGEIQWDKFHGKGVMRYANGDRYEGDWADNQPNGLGKYFFHTGERYEGEFRQGRFHGKGTFFYADGSRYEGQWLNSKRHGSGTLTFSDGTSWSGQWVEDRRLTQTASPPLPSEAAPASLPALPNCNETYCADGQGFYVYADGSQYVGEFHMGVPEGKAVVHYANGNRYEGYWKNHAPHGEGVLYLADGKVVGAVWENGKLVRELPPPEEPMPKAYVGPLKDEAVRIWAVIVGVANYQHMPALRYTDDDAYKFYAHLKSPEGGALPDEQLRILVDENATRQNILETMREVFLRADENDVVIFYFSGHGLPGAFIPVDYDGYHHRLLHEEIKKILQDTRARHKLVIGDACHSGSLLALEGMDLLAARGPVDQTLHRFYSAFENARGGLALLMSSKEEEVSLEDSGLRSGIFSYYLIRGLRGEADADGDAIVSIGELYDFLYEKVRNYTANAQTPALTGDFDRRMPVAVVRRDYSAGE